MSGGMDTKIGGLSSLIVTAPSWKKSVLIIVALGLMVTGMIYLKQGIPDEVKEFFGLSFYIIPGLIAFLFTPVLIRLAGGRISWDWSGLIAALGTVFSVIISISPAILLDPGDFALFYAISLGFVFFIRTMALLAVAYYRLRGVLLPALLPSIAGGIAGTLHFAPDMSFSLYVVLLHIFFALGVYFFAWVIEKPLSNSFNINLFAFSNAFISHITEGSNALEDYFAGMGEPVNVYHVTFFFERKGKERGIFMVPNVHPGPLGEIGGSNLPFIIHDRLGENTMVAHGAATHDFNPVRESELEKLIDAVRDSEPGLQFTDTAGRSARYGHGSVEVLAQRFGDSLLVVETRSPENTEDIEYSVGLSAMLECEKYFSHAAVADAHNSLDELAQPVLLGSGISEDYIGAARNAAESLASKDESFSFEAGFSRVPLPFERPEGAGDLGVQVMLIRAGGQETAYILFDSNNLYRGFREEIRDKVLTMVDECEILTTDTHVVNTVSGFNPLGLSITADQVLPYVEEAVRMAGDDLAPAGSASAKAHCKGIVVFGSQRISQLGGVVSSLVSFIIPVVVVIIILAFLSTSITYFALA